MRTKPILSIALTAFVIFSVLCLIRPEEKNHDRGFTASEVTLVTEESGNQERRTYVNQDGQPVVPLDRGYATLLRGKDADGNVILEQYLDARGQPVLRSGNYAAIAYRREPGEIQITYLDAGLNPTTISSGYSSIHRTLTAEGRALRDAYYDLQGRPVKCTGGYFGLLRSYDAQGWLREIVYLDASGKPTRTTGGYCREVRIPDEAGRVAAVYYRDAAGNPVSTAQGQYGEGYQRDENGRTSLITYLDASGNPSPVNAGYTMLSRSYYRDGSVFEERYFDADGNPVALSKGQYGIVFGNLFGVVGSFPQARNRYCAICSGGIGRTGYSVGAVGIRIQPDLPATQVCTCVRGLNQLYAASIQLVRETDRCRDTCGYSYGLRIGAGTVVQSIDGAVCVPDFLDIVGAGGKPRNGNLTAGVCTVRPGNKGGAGRIGVDSKPPAGQVLAVLGGFGQADGAGIQYNGPQEIDHLFQMNREHGMACWPTTIVKATPTQPKNTSASVWLASAGCPTS